MCALLTVSHVHTGLVKVDCLCGRLDWPQNTSSVSWKYTEVDTKKPPRMFSDSIQVAAKGTLPICHLNLSDIGLRQSKLKQKKKKHFTSEIKCKPFMQHQKMLIV